MGDVVLLELLKSRGLLPKFDAGVDVFCLIEDETLRAESLKLITELRAAGKVVEYSFTPLKADKQFKRAMELNAANTVRLERTADGMVSARIKNLRSRTEQVSAVAEVAAKLG
jgi:histidyl-tRNA synthetase